MKAVPPRSKTRSDAARPAPSKGAPGQRGVARASAKPVVAKAHATKGSAAAVKAKGKPAPAPVAARPTPPAAVKATKPTAKAVPAKATKAVVPASKAPAAVTKARAGKAALGVKAPAVAATKVPRKSVKEAAGVGTDAVARRTGKNWDAWFEVLDTAGAAHLDQRGIIAILAQKHGIGPWWQQMIAVGYEAVRGKSETAPVVVGFQASSSCTLAVPPARAFKLWSDSGERARWLADDRFVVRAYTPGKSIQARWGKGDSHVSISLTERGASTEVSVEHHQIESRRAADQMKNYWEKKLGLLQQAVGAAR